MLVFRDPAQPSYKAGQTFLGFVLPKIVIRRQRLELASADEYVGASSLPLARTPAPDEQNVVRLYDFDAEP